VPSQCLVDTNVILRLSQPEALAPGFHHAVSYLRAQECTLYVAFQNIAEYWNVSTRPVLHNGLGLNPDKVLRSLDVIRDELEIVTEDRETFDRWLRLVVDFRVLGRQVHDARLVAHMLVRNIPWLLTSNVKDFVRYSGIQAIDPERIP
jgi:hypothetical protein